MKIDFSASAQTPANEEEGFFFSSLFLLKDGRDKCWERGKKIYLSTYINCGSSNKRYQVLNRCDLTSPPPAVMTWQRVKNL